MKQAQQNALRFNNISDLFSRLGLSAPLHPLIGLVDYDRTPIDLSDAGCWIELDFYKISFKKSFNGSVNYGPGRYDFKEGGMAFLEPGQFVQKSGDPADYQGYALYFHPDLLRGHSLAEKIHRYGFFSYAVAESLFLSEKEKNIIGSLFLAIDAELESRLDQFSDEVLITQLELLLNHSNRFYHRQFLTRKLLHHQIIDKMNVWLNHYFDNTTGIVSGLPSPKDIATHVDVSQRYLSDMLKTLTGKTTQEHIHICLINKAKQLLAQDGMTTAEVAYKLGFEHPQSFNKLFKQKTDLSPAAFRQNLHAN